jgi:hypothetical protein
MPARSGEKLRQAAFAAARRHLPGDGWRFFEVRHEFPDAWQQLQDTAREEGRHALLRLRLERQMFPFVPHGREITLEAAAILFGAHGEEARDCPEFEACPCPDPRGRATCWIEVRRCDRSDDENRDAETVLCYASEEWPDLYCGVFTTGAALGGRHRYAEFDIRFGDGVRDIGPVFLLCRYRTDECAGTHREMFSDPISWTDRLSRLNRPPSLPGEQHLANVDYPLGNRQIPRLR